jgi:hypothetical protein
LLFGNRLPTPLQLLVYPSRGDRRFAAVTVIERPIGDRDPPQPAQQSADRVIGRHDYELLALLVAILAVFTFMALTIGVSPTA